MYSVQYVYYSIIHEIAFKGSQICTITMLYHSIYKLHMGVDFIPELCFHSFKTFSTVNDFSISRLVHHRWHIRLHLQLRCVPPGHVTTYRQMDQAQLWWWSKSTCRQVLHSAATSNPFMIAIISTFISFPSNSLVGLCKLKYP